MGKIYLIKCYNDFEILYKIGYTKGKVEKRLKSLETGNPNKLELECYYESKYNTKLESYLHRHFGSKKVKNEWFNLQNDDVKNFLSTCKTAEDRFDYLMENNDYFEKLL